MRNWIDLIEELSNDKELLTEDVASSIKSYFEKSLNFFRGNHVSYKEALFYYDKIEEVTGKPYHLFPKNKLKIVSATTLQEFGAILASQYAVLYKFGFNSSGLIVSGVVVLVMAIAKYYLIMHSRSTAIQVGLDYESEQQRSADRTIDVDFKTIKVDVK